MSEKRLPLLDAAAQQLGWWGAVLCASLGLLAPAAAAAFLPLALLLALGTDRARILGLALAAAAYGLSLDSLLTRSGLLHFAGGGSLPPAWMVGLWASFGAALTASLSRPARWPLPLLAAAAAIAGPVAYRGGAALGAIEFGPAGLWPAAAAVAAQWAFGVPILSVLARQSPGEGRTGTAAPERP